MKILSFPKYKICGRFEIIIKEKCVNTKLMRISVKLPFYYPCEAVDLSIIEVNE